MMKRGLRRPVVQRPIGKPRTTQVWRILVTTDFSRPSFQAIPCALALARHFGAEVHLLHVVDTTQCSSKRLMLPLLSPAELSRPLLNRLQGVALKFAPDGEIHVMKPREGRAYDKICEAARQLHAGLIVIATHGFTGLKHVLLGSTAERVVQHSPCPVLVVGQQRHRLQEGKIRLRKILVPTDFSDCAQLAFHCSARLAREFGAELLLVHVIDRFSYPFGDAHAALDSARLMKEVRASAQKEMNKMASQAKVRVSVQVRKGSPATQICNAGKKNVDMIVTPTHGRTGLSHVLIGSVAERVVHCATCPVLVMPAGGKLRKRK